MDLTQLFCSVDTFCLDLQQQAHAASFARAPFLLQSPRKGPTPGLIHSEVITLLVFFHHSRFRDFKTYYTQFVTVHLRGHFPGLVSYSRFLSLVPKCSVYLVAFLTSLFGKCSGISFIDATKLAVCHSRRGKRNKVFDGLAAWGKTGMGFFFGFKLHLAINERGELLGVALTPGNRDDRKAAPSVLKRVFGKVYGDKGYISQKLWEELMGKGLELLTPLRKNMKAKPRSEVDLVLLRRRVVIETVNDQLKNISQIEHSRHRSPRNFVVNVVSGLIAYSLQPKKPSLRTAPDPAVLACA